MSSNKKVVKFVGQTATFLTTIREKAKNVYTFIIALFNYLSRCQFKIRKYPQ